MNKSQTYSVTNNPMTTLYIGVDESGLPLDAPCYAVAACWCVSEYDDPEQVLKPLRSRTMKYASSHRDGPASLNELKGNKMRYILNDVFKYLLGSGGAVWSNESLVRPIWQNSQPIRYMIRAMNSNLANQTLTEYISGDNESTAIQIAALNYVLMPLFWEGQLALERCDEIRVLLDSTTWSRCANTFEQNIETVLSASLTPSFEIRDSKSTPNIQFADIAAHSTYQSLCNGRCDGAMSYISNWSL